MLSGKSNTQPFTRLISKSVNQWLSTRDIDETQSWSFQKVLIVGSLLRPVKSVSQWAGPVHWHFFLKFSRRLKPEASADIPEQEQFKGPGSSVGLHSTDLSKMTTSNSLMTKKPASLRWPIQWNLGSMLCMVCVCVYIHMCEFPNLSIKLLNCLAVLWIENVNIEHEVSKPENLIMVQNGSRVK